jgi:hypothetical protein
MNEIIDNGCPREIRRLDVETPLGVVHLVGFAQKPDHRSVIFSILSDFSGMTVTASDLQESKEDPRPRFPKLDFDVNWTHSAGFCVLAFGERGSDLRIGVDLERYSPKRLHLADRFFSVEEAAYIKSLAESSAMDPCGEKTAERGFFKLWCRKEAFYKCVGGDFFEGTLRRPMLHNPLLLENAKSPVQGTGDRVEVHFVDLEGDSVGATEPAALCIAVSSR